MKSRVALILLSSFLTLGPSASFARIPRRTLTRVDSSYSSALAAANRFLHAWQTQDHETGILMLSDGARQRASREKLQDFFSPGEPAAFEIQRGRRLRDGKYLFPVVLFGVSDENQRPRSCALVITRAGKDDWVVDRLP